MPIESATFISDLVPANPPGTDALSTAADHLRLTKSVVKATFPNVVGALTASNVELNYVTGVTSAIQGQLNAPASVASINGGQLAGMRNRVVNGFGLVQQVAAPTLTSAYQYGAADKMMVSIVGGSAVSGTAGVITTLGTGVGVGYGAIAATWTTGQAAVQHRIESNLVGDMNGKTVTLSGKVYHDFGGSRSISVQLLKANTVDGFGAQTVLAPTTTVVVPSGTVTPFSLTYTLGAAEATNGLSLGVFDNAANSVVAKNFVVTELQLVIGTVATPFEQRPYGLEFILCQRYLPMFTFAGANLDIGAGSIYAATTGLCFMSFPVTPRIAPTGVTISSGAGLKFLAAGASYVSSSIVLNSASTSGASLSATISGATPGQSALVTSGAAVTIQYTGCQL